MPFHIEEGRENVERKRKVEALGNRPLSVMPLSLFSTKESEFSMENFCSLSSVMSCCFTAWCDFDGVIVLVFISLNILIYVLFKLFEWNMRFIDCD